MPGDHYEQYLQRLREHFPGGQAHPQENHYMRYGKRRSPKTAAGRARAMALKTKDKIEDLGEYIRVTGEGHEPITFVNWDQVEDYIRKRLYRRHSAAGTNIEHKVTGKADGPDLDVKPVKKSLEDEWDFDEDGFESEGYEEDAETYELAPDSMFRPAEEAPADIDIEVAAPVSITPADEPSGIPGGGGMPPSTVPESPQERPASGEQPRPRPQERPASGEQPRPRPPARRRPSGQMRRGGSAGGGTSSPYGGPPDANKAAWEAEGAVRQLAGLYRLPIGVGRDGRIHLGDEKFNTWFDAQKFIERLHAEMSKRRRTEAVDPLNPMVGMEPDRLSPEPSVGEFAELWEPTLIQPPDIPPDDPEYFDAEAEARIATEALLGRLGGSVRPDGEGFVLQLPEGFHPQESPSFISWQQARDWLGAASQPMGQAPTAPMLTQEPIPLPGAPESTVDYETYRVQKAYEPTDEELETAEREDYWEEQDYQQQQQREQAAYEQQQQREQAEYEKQQQRQQQEQQKVQFQQGIEDAKRQQEEQIQRHVDKVKAIRRYQADLVDYGNDYFNWFYRGRKNGEPMPRRPRHPLDEFGNPIPITYGSYRLKKAYEPTDEEKQEYEAEQYWEDLDDAKRQQEEEQAYQTQQRREEEQYRKQLGRRQWEDAWRRQRDKQERRRAQQEQERERRAAQMRQDEAAQLERERQASTALAEMGLSPSAHGRYTVGSQTYDSAEEAYRAALVQQEKRRQSAARRRYNEELLRRVYGGKPGPQLTESYDGLSYEEYRHLRKGGEGSGHFDHEGRPGKVGGSLPSDAGKRDGGDKPQRRAREPKDKESSFQVKELLPEWYGGIYDRLLKQYILARPKRQGDYPKFNDLNDEQRAVIEQMIEAQHPLVYAGAESAFLPDAVVDEVLRPAAGKIADAIDFMTYDRAGQRIQNYVNFGLYFLGIHARGKYKEKVLRDIEEANEEIDRYNQARMTRWTEIEPKNWIDKETGEVIPVDDPRVPKPPQEEIQLDVDERIRRDTLKRGKDWNQMPDSDKRSWERRAADYENPVNPRNLYDNALKRWKRAGEQFEKLSPDEQALILSRSRKPSAALQEYQKRMTEWKARHEPDVKPFIPKPRKDKPRWLFPHTEGGRFASYIFNPWSLSANVAGSLFMAHVLPKWSQELRKYAKGDPRAFNEWLDKYVKHKTKEQKEEREASDEL